MSDDVTNWLDELGLGEYASVFEKNNVDIEVLPELTDADLKELGVTLGHRKRVLKAIRALTEVELDSPVSPATPLAGVTAAVTTGVDARLAAWERMPGERKPVTMLFADITGSTALTEKLDAEETHDLLYGATQRMCAAVENNRGTVCRFMGDGVMSMFGAPVASEHHAIDACEAALEMQHAIRDYASDIEGLQIRVGLHSGEVVVLTVGEGDKVEYDASGPTVPIAARMEQVAQPGDVYLTAATQSLAADRIETEALGPVSVKGVSEPVPVFALRRVRSVEEARRDSARTPFVGRRADLIQFRGMLEACIEEGHGQTAYIRGEPGIGKTRLVEEFARIAAEKGVSTHRGLVLPFGVGKGQDAVRSLVRSLMGIAPGGGKDERQRAANKALNDGRLEPGQEVFLNDLLDLPQPTEQRALYDAMDNATRNEGKQRVASKLLAAIGTIRPVLAVIEDVHWADGITLAHLAALAKTAAEFPALLVMTSRIEGDQLDRQWLSGIEGSPFLTIELGPLRRQDSIALIGEFIDTSDELAESCLERASGNPLFLEQLLRTAQEGSTDSLPDSIQSLVLARIDRLTPVDKRALQAASVIGQRFDIDSLRHVLGDGKYSCTALVEHSLVRSDGTSYLFGHALIQEGVYASLLKRQRQELHRSAAAWYAHNDTVLYAEHLDHAGDEEAASAYLAAARDQAGQYRFERALDLANRGIGTVAKDAGFELHCLKGELLRSLGKAPDSTAAYQRALEVANDEVETCRALIGLAEGLRITEAHDKLIEALDRAEAIAKTHKLLSQMAKIYQLRGGVHFMRGEVESCLQANRMVLDLAPEMGSSEVEAQALSGMADVEYARGRMKSAHRYFRQCVELGQEHGFGRVIGANLSMVAHTQVYLNAYQKAAESFRAARDLAVRTRQVRAELIALGGGTIFVDMGNVVEGEEWLKIRLDLARRLGARGFECAALSTLGKVAFRQGRHREANELAQMALAINSDSESVMRFFGAPAFSTLAYVSDVLEERRTALKKGEELLRSGCVSHCHFGFYRDAMDVCLQTGDLGEAERYAQALADYTSAEPLPWSEFFIARARVLAAFARGDRNDTTMRELQRLRDEAESVALKVAIPALDEALSST